MQYANSILELFGNTPLVKLNKVVDDIPATILVKVEYLNPGGSIKDRIAVSMIDAAEKEGHLKPGGTIVEPTSGNTGVGLALVATQRGYKCIFTMPDKVSVEKEDVLKAYGAEVVRCPTAVEPEDARSYYKVAERLAAETPGGYVLNQYGNPNNPLAHYHSTGPEVWAQTDGRISTFVAGMGTGGTITGAGRFLKEKNANIQLVGIDPEGSIYSDPSNIHTYLVEGIGEDFYPTTIDLDLVDHVVQVFDKESFDMTRRLAREEGLLVGISSGSAVVGALRHAREANLTADDVVVIILPDSGRSYISKAFSEDWLKTNGLLD